MAGNGYCDKLNITIHKQEGEDQNLGQNLGFSLGILNGFCLGHLGTAGITESGRRWPEKENGQDE